MSLKHTGSKTLHTARLILRKFEVNDADGMLKIWISDPEVQRNYGEPVYGVMQDVQELLKKWRMAYEEESFYRWAVVLKENNQNIGQIAFCRVYTDIKSAEIEYCISKAYWGHGYATEALEAVIEYAFEYPGFDRIEAFHMVSNPSSGRVLQKAGMQRARNIRRFDKNNDFYDDRIFYAALRIPNR